jgi:hypothetical protein
MRSQEWTIISMELRTTQVGPKKRSFFSISDHGGTGMNLLLCIAGELARETNCAEMIWLRFITPPKNVSMEKQVNSLSAPM